MKKLSDNYDHRLAEKTWQARWEEKKIYAWDESQKRENTFVIDTPPPTVSGVLHMGHIFSYTQADFVARYQRMAGKTVFYPMGFDDNGLPTERLVEKVKKKKAREYESREAFIEACESVAEEARIEFRKLFTSVALSVDWAQEYHTISEESRRISQLSFLDLHRKGRAYRKLQPMLWDPVDQTAIAQAEIEDKEMASSWSDIAFEVAGDGKIVIGTTRPELLPACVAVFYHPEDERYRHLEGKTAVTPLFSIKVPILADPDVKIDKGTGLVMCCTFGDEQDVKWQERHNLPLRIVLNKYGKLDTEALNDVAGESINQAVAKSAIERIQNKKTTNPDAKNPGAREEVLAMLKDAGLLLKQEPITHAVKCAERSGAPLEIIPTHQWFVKILDQKEELKARARECNWHPEYMRIRMEQWIDGLSWDWCISRQRYFGVPFPVWYVQKPEAGNQKPEIVTARPEDLPVNPLTSLPRGYTVVDGAGQLGQAVRAVEDATGQEILIIPEADVMDTWATSSVSPQLSSRGIAPGSHPLPQAGEGSAGNPFLHDPARHAKLFPADLRPQAHEIIRTWAFYTIVKAHLHESTVPWKNLMISGWCLAADKSKMSKSKGNVITPVELIEEKGADAVRYWASTSRLGSDTAFSEDVLKIGRKLVTKLWNAAKFAAIQLEKMEGAPQTAEADVKRGVITETLDLWILTRLKRAVEKASLEFGRFEYCDARAAIEDFFWNDFCDNYLEMVKGRAYGVEGPGVRGQWSGKQQSAICAIYHCLETVLRLFAPFVPHVTDEIYSHIFDDRHARLGSIHARGNWPRACDLLEDAEAEKTGIAAVEILNAVRKMKAERNVSLKWPLEKIIIAPGPESGGCELISPAFADLASVANAAEIIWLDKAPSGSVLVASGLYAVSAAFAAQSGAA